MAIWHLGQSGAAVKMKESICFFDPYLSNYIEDNRLVEPPGLLRRNFDPPARPEEVTIADIVLITHDHLDHLDPETVTGIAKHSPQACFICPAPSASKLVQLGIEHGRIYPAKATETINMYGIEVTAIPAKHEEYLTDSYGHHYYLGYVLKSNGVTFYHAGDTIGFSELVEYLRPFFIDVAYLPINGMDWMRAKQGVLGNMGYRDAIELARAAGIDLIIPAHYDLFESNTENPAFFVDYLYRYNPGQRFKMLVPGERLLYLSERN